MKKLMAFAFVVIFLSGCGVQSIPRAKNRTEETFAEITNQYKRRADLHSLTSKHDPKELHDRILNFFAQYIACGLDPDKNVIFIQSHVHCHAELTWVLNCHTPMGALNRMTQFKDKSQKQRIEK